MGARGMLIQKRLWEGEGMLGMRYVTLAKRVEW